MVTAPFQVRDKQVSHFEREWAAHRSSGRDAVWVPARLTATIKSVILIVRTLRQ